MPVWLQASIISHFGVNGLPDERLVLYECPEDGTDASPNVHQGTNTCSLFSLSSSLFIENNRAFKERRTESKNEYHSFSCRFRPCFIIIVIIALQMLCIFLHQPFKWRIIIKVGSAHSATKNSSEVAMVCYEKDSILKRSLW
ncbi:hypothetical protein T4B_4589 [Trichinella pseudospiralis]|uniref:Uncharacterized protein n=1 Tax=Trichinella pseudospiralis TaxID=6337 RepID=A0A0V1GSD2_TRIPS|nr:hypothetical protein T4B_4589 [Trichinella pseudospiralis]